MIKKFSKLGFSPPIDQEELPALQKKIKALQDALTSKGKIEQLEGKIKFTRKASQIATETTPENNNEEEETKDQKANENEDAEAKKELEKLQEDFNVFDLEIKR